MTETKNRLSALVDQVRHSETIVILDRGRPVARLESILDSDSASEGRPNDKRTSKLGSGAVSHLGRFIDELIESGIDKIGELDLRYGPETVDSHPYRHPDNCRFGQRRVEGPLGTELFE